MHEKQISIDKTVQEGGLFSSNLSPLIRQNIKCLKWIIDRQIKSEKKTKKYNQQWSIQWCNSIQKIWNVCVFDFIIKLMIIEANRANVNLDLIPNGIAHITTTTTVATK